MKDNKSASLFPKEQVIESLKQSFVKLNPRIMIKNPIMFTVEVATVVMLLVTLYSIVNSSQGSFAYNIAVFIILFVTLLFANFAEAIAEARGKAQADSLRKTREETPAKKVEGNKIVTVSSSQLKKGDVFVCEAGDVIPSDGEIIEGLASIDESAITGESAPVIREAGGDKSSVTGGTKVLSDHIKVLVTTQPGESFLDKMIALVEGASRQKTPNEIALTILLAGFTLVFVIVCVTLKPFADYSHTVITIASLISLFVCLIPTTIGGLLSAIGIAGMDRALRANVITKSGKAVETAGDIDTLLLDKTGTITIGNRKATSLAIEKVVSVPRVISNCLPISTISISFVGSLSRSTILPASFAACVPLFMATPTLACARAGASFVPSPIIATNLPACCSFLIYSILSSGLASAIKSSTPAISAIYFAVNGLSPVTMTVFTPILRRRSKRS
jgi:potassium-transporting ATPase ATP-binding subunit